MQLVDTKFMQKHKEETTVTEFQWNTCLMVLKASASACCILSFEVIKDIKDPLVMALEVENAFCHLRRQLLSLFFALLAAQAAQKASHTWFLTEAAATHGMNSSLNILWVAASSSLLDV